MAVPLHILTHLDIHTLHLYVHTHNSDAFNEEALLRSFIRHAHYRASRSMQRYFYEVLIDLIPEEAYKLDEPGVCGRPKGAYEGTYKKRENSKKKGPKKEAKKKESRKKVAAPTTAPHIFPVSPSTTPTTITSSPPFFPTRHPMPVSSSCDTTTTQATSMASSSSSSSAYSRSGDISAAHFSPFYIGHPTGHTVTIVQPIFVDLEREMNATSSKGSKSKFSDNEEGEEYYPAASKKARIEGMALVVEEEEDLLEDPVLQEMVEDPALQGFFECWGAPDAEDVEMEVGWMELAQAIVIDPVVAAAVTATSVEDMEFEEGFDDIYWEL